MQQHSRNGSARLANSWFPLISVNEKHVAFSLLAEKAIVIGKSYRLSISLLDWNRNCKTLPQLFCIIVTLKNRWLS